MKKHLAACRRRLAILLYGEILMTLEDQVAGLVAAQAETTAALNAIQTTLTAVQSTLANLPTNGGTTVDLTPVETAIAGVQTSVNQVLAQLEPSPVVTGTGTNTGSTNSSDTGSQSSAS